MKSITLLLSAQAYQAVIIGLQELPWKVADPVLREINPQVQAALELEKSRESEKGETT